MLERTWGVHWRAEPALLPDTMPGPSWLGVGAGAFNTGTASNPNSRIRFLLIPYWLVVALTAAPVTVWVLGQRKRRRRCAGGLCLRCGYDLRATPDRCPECGNATPVTTTA